MPEKKLSLLSFDENGEAAKQLIDKVSNAIGWIATRETPKRLAVNTYIEEIKNSNLDPITKACLISNAAKTIKEYSQQQNILQIAINNIRKDAKPNEIENDWVSQFMDKARLVSDSVFQLIWGKVLAEECNQPGTIPRSLLHTLEKMDKRDAELFTLICSFSVYNIESGVPEYTPIIVHDRLDEFYNNRGVTYNSIVDLTSLGLIENDFSAIASGYQETITTLPIQIHYFDKEIHFSEGVRKIPIGNVIFTKTGQALCSAIEAEKQEGFWETICLPLWNEDTINALNPTAKD